MASLHPVDENDFREVELEILPDGYAAGTLYLRRDHAEAILRRLEGASDGFVGELEVRHVPPPL